MEKIKKDLTHFLSPYVPHLSEEKWKDLIETPKKREHGLLAFCVFSLHSKPVQYAQDLAQQLEKSKPNFIEHIQAFSGFINFHFTSKYIQQVFLQTFRKGFITKEGKDAVWVIDYSSPNIAKYMNVGHLRATVIGQAITNMARAYGYKVIALNHLGDWGTQFGKLIVAYQKWGRSQKLSLDQLVELYVRFHRLAQDQPLLASSAREAFRKMEQGDTQFMQLWSSFVEVSMENYKSIWKKLKVQHDLTLGESFYRDKTSRVEQILQNKKALKESEGAKVVFLDSDQPPCLIQKKDGASTYACRDLASALYRFEELKSDRNIYVAGVDHNLHFSQLKSVLKKINPLWADRSAHLSFGMYRFEGKGKLSSRQGQTVSLSNLIEQACTRVKDIISAKNPSLEDKEQIAENVGVGALIFNDLKNDRIKDVVFSWNHILNFEGDSGPYVQYCHVRCVSILKKAHVNPDQWDVIEPLEIQQWEPLEMELIETLLLFETRLLQSFQKFKPHILAVYLLELCRVFNRFYKKYRIIDSSKMKERLMLVKAVKKVLQKGLGLLNVEAPLAM